MDKFKIIEKNQINELPKNSGVYAFYDKKGLVYIGKAINIQSRVKNHFNQPSYRDNLYIKNVDKVGFLETNSEIEALILEANLIKKYQPKFNVVWKDGKNYFFVAIAQNENKIPYVFITHQKNYEKTEYVGPFVEGTALKKTLRFLRRVFPYYTTKKHPKTKCTYCHLGLCPGPVPDLDDYKKNIKKLILILQGKRSAVLNSLKQEMSQLSKESKFEEAGKIRDRIYNLHQVMSHTSVIEAPKTKSDEWLKTEQILKRLLGLEKVSRIECYDISNIQGNQATGSMVVFTNGSANKNEYKKFRIKMENKPNDIAMLKEVLQRRFAHSEWTYPEVILIDGGKAQLNAGINSKSEARNPKQIQNIKVISIAKKNKDLYIEGRDGFIPLKTLPREIYNLVLQLDDEAHRFAISYHKKLRKKNLLV
ncbi:MAG: GIY-YIG nuclease family protein [Candidatus Staskawiczbacteria bacterium]|jgi:excinuclease ABC subunit C